MFMEQGVFVEVGVERGESRLVGKEKLQNSKKEQVGHLDPVEKAWRRNAFPWLSLTRSLCDDLTMSVSPVRAQKSGTWPGFAHHASCVWLRAQHIVKAE